MTLGARGPRGASVAADVSQQRRALISRLELSSDFGVYLISFDLLYSDPVEPSILCTRPPRCVPRTAAASRNYFRLLGSARG